MATWTADNTVVWNDGTSSVIVRGTREMATTTGYHTADALARSILPGARLMRSWEGLDGQPRRSYLAPTPR